MPTAAVRSLDSINRVVQAFCSEGVPYKSVSEIAKICRGQVMSKDFLRDNAGEYPVYSSQTENDGMLGKITTYMFDGEYLTWTTDGANAGTVFYRKGKFSVTNVCGVIDVTDETILIKIPILCAYIVPGLYFYRQPCGGNCQRDCPLRPR